MSLFWFITITFFYIVLFLINLAIIAKKLKKTEQKIQKCLDIYGHKHKKRR